MGEIIEFNQQSVQGNIDKPTFKELLKNLKSAIAFDIAPHHTGIMIWDGVELKDYGSHLTTPDTSNPHWEYILRRDFKAEVREIVREKAFEACIVENVHGEENFVTVRQLLALNTVPDELLFEGTFHADEFYRWSASEWMAKTRKIYKQENKLKSKVETQGLLSYLDCEYYLKYKDYPEKERDARELNLPTKADICFEDKCDACGMLMALVSNKIYKDNTPKSSSIKKSSIKYIYLEDIEDTYDCKDEKIRTGKYITVELNHKTLEQSIIAMLERYQAGTMLCSYVPTVSLGRFGIENNLTFHTSGEGYLFFSRR